MPEPEDSAHRNHVDHVDHVDNAHGANATDAAGGSHSGHNHGAGASTRRLALALVLTVSFLVAEVIGAYWYNSLALLSDAAHMFTDSAALAIALVAGWIGQRPADSQRTYGYRRFEILAAAFNAVLLFVVAAFILVEGVQRLFTPVEVQATGMLIVASIGLLVNLIAMRILGGGQADNLNVKGAYLEVWADMLGSIGVIGAALAIRFTGQSWIDPVVAIAIGLWVLPRTWTLLRDTTHILLQGVPRGIDLDAVRSALAAIDGVADTHDLHLWSVAGDDRSLTVHLALLSGADGETVRLTATNMLNDRFAIRHATIQTEVTACADAPDKHA